MNLKQLLFVLLALVLGSCQKEGALAPDCLPSRLQNGLLAYYTFRDGDLTDQSKNDHDLQNPTTARATSDRRGNPDCAFIFDSAQGNGEYLTTSASSFLNGLSKLSIALWYQPIDTTRNGNSHEILLSRGEELHCPDKKGEWSLSLYDCRRAVFGHNNSVWANFWNGPNWSCQGEVNYLTEKWHHVVATKNRDEYKIYVNGILQETANGNGDCPDFHLAQDIGDFFVGKWYTGKIDDILIYDKALSQTDVSELYDLEPCCSN